MPIEEHKNIGLENIGPRGTAGLAVGSSNSNSHNAGGGGEVTRPELEQIMGQLSGLLPQLQRAVDQQSNPK